MAESPYRPVPKQLTDTGDPVFESCWARVEDEWEDEAVHATMLNHAINAARLPELAGRYAKYKDDVTRGEFATKRIAAVTFAAMSLLESTRTPKYQRPPWYIVGSALLIFICALIFVWATLSR